MHRPSFFPFALIIPIFLISIWSVSAQNTGGIEKIFSHFQYGTAVGKRGLPCSPISMIDQKKNGGKTCNRFGSWDSIPSAPGSNGQLVNRNRGYIIFKIFTSSCGLQMTWVLWFLYRFI